MSSTAPPAAAPRSPLSDALAQRIVEASERVIRQFHEDFPDANEIDVLAAIAQVAKRQADACIAVEAAAAARNELQRFDLLLFSGADLSCFLDQLVELAFLGKVDVVSDRALIYGWPETLPAVLVSAINRRCRTDPTDTSGRVVTRAMVQGMLALGWFEKQDAEELRREVLDCTRRNPNGQ
ncbi:hypothetical protein RAS1_29050 [Phycisphaerae bacterium RAS1]|nr:hypothetical protein RAS1_29050 [Phycisphaerae bacterium RAS1]